MIEILSIMGIKISFILALKHYRQQQYIMIIFLQEFKDKWFANRNNRFYGFKCNIITDQNSTNSQTSIRID